MRKLPLIVAIVLTAGCGAMTPGRSPEDQCYYFVKLEGFQWVRDIKSAPVAGGTAVTMELKDALARSFTATCIYTDGKMRWAEPLPSNAVRDFFGRDKQ